MRIKAHVTNGWWRVGTVLLSGNTAPHFGDGRIRAETGNAQLAMCAPIWSRGMPCAWLGARLVAGPGEATQVGPEIACPGEAAPPNQGLPGRMRPIHRAAIATRAAAPGGSLAPRQSPSLVKLKSVLI
jgi:hypothetical protein